MHLTSNRTKQLIPCMGGGDSRFSENVHADKIKFVQIGRMMS